MNLSDQLSLVGDVLAVTAIVVALRIYNRQSQQSAKQGDLIEQIKALTAQQDRRATALANLELREKFGTISSRAERLSSIGSGKKASDFEVCSSMTEDERDTVLEHRAQIMYTIYDCLAVDQVFDEANDEVKDQFRELMHGYDTIWRKIPVLHGNRSELRNMDGKTLFHLFKSCLKVYRSQNSTD